MRSLTVSLLSGLILSMGLFDSATTLAVIGSANRFSAWANRGCAASHLHTPQEDDPACSGGWWIARDGR